MSFSLSCRPAGLARVMAPMVARTIRKEVQQIDRLAVVLDAPRPA